jgi:hypothetical protein
LLLFVYLLSSVMPLFYFALYRSEKDLYPVTRHRRLALASAVVYLVILAAGLPSLFGSLSRSWSTIRSINWTVGAASIAAAAANGGPLILITSLLSIVSNLACILVLVALFRQKRLTPSP